MSSRYPMSSYPIGWYRVAGKDELRFGQILGVSALGMKLALFRDSMGEAHAVAAYCAHLGADLSIGGTVCGDHVVCPFHHWRYDGSGHCTGVEPPGRIPPRAEISAYPTREVNGGIVIFWHPNGEPPSWELPAYIDFDDTKLWTPWETRHWRIKTHVQEVFENGPDSVHQKTLHCALEFPTSTFETSGHMFKGTLAAPYEAGAGLPDVVAQQQSEYTNHGMGFAQFSMQLDYSGIRVNRQIHFWITPVSEDLVLATLETRMERLDDSALTEVANREATHHTWRSFEEDIPIWENKVYRPMRRVADHSVSPAVLTEGDRGVAAVRHWARQFYL